MERYETEVRSITTEEYQTLRNSTGWNTISDKAVAQALSNDLFSVCVMHRGQVVGMGRVIGDRAIYFYVQDVIVLPAFQGKGIGGKIMEEIRAYLTSNAGNGAFIGLMAAEGVAGFYKQYGFVERDVKKPGMYMLVN